MNEIVNPVTGERIVFRMGAGNEKAPILGFDFFLRPGGGVFVPHFHKYQSESLVVLHGRLLCGLGKAVREVGIGETITFKPGEGHTLAVAGKEEVHAYVEFKPALRAESFLRNYFGLCRDGESDKKGEISLLQISLLMPYHEVWRADIPLVAQKILFFILRPLARALGYKEKYKEYLED